MAVTPPMPPPVLSKASTPVTKYFDLIATQSSGPLTVRVSPGLRPLKSVRSASFCLVTSGERLVVLLDVGLGIGQRGTHADEQRAPVGARHR